MHSTITSPLSDDTDMHSGLPGMKEWPLYLFLVLEIAWARFSFGFFGLFQNETCELILATKQPCNNPVEILAMSHNALLSYSFIVPYAYVLITLKGEDVHKQYKGLSGLSMIVTLLQCVGLFFLVTKRPTDAPSTSTYQSDEDQEPSNTNHSTVNPMYKIILISVHFVMVYLLGSSYYTLESTLPRIRPFNLTCHLQRWTPKAYVTLTMSCFACHILYLSNDYTSGFYAMNMSDTRVDPTVGDPAFAVTTTLVNLWNWSLVLMMTTLLTPDK